MKNKKIDIIASKLVKAFLKNKIISPIPSQYSKNIQEANNFRKLCESKIDKPIIGFKAGGTALPVLKKLKEKEPFYSAVYKHNLLKNNKSVKINKYVLGIELEVCYVIKKTFFNLKQSVTKKNINRYISYMAPCIEIVGYRQKKKGISYLGDLASDFGANIKFIVGKKIKFKNINIQNLTTKITNVKSNYSVSGNTNTVYINPINSLKFVLSKLQKEKINLRKNFFVFTGSTVGVVPLSYKGYYKGRIEKLGSVSTKII